MFILSGRKMRYSIALLMLTPGFIYGITVPTCLPGFQWAFNHLNQSPCEVASQLGGTCTGTPLGLGSLTANEIYLGPGTTNANTCECSTVLYSVLSACALCQGASITNWTFYKQNCTTVLVTVFPSPIPSGLAVPNYAYLDVTVVTGDGVPAFNQSLAQADMGPDSTAIPQPTDSRSNPTTTSQGTSKKPKTNSGAIAGGVIGGIVAILLIAGALLVFRRRRRSQRQEGPFHDSTGNQFSAMAENTTGSPGTPALAKIYDPNDPSTYPGTSHPLSIPSIYSSQVTASNSQQFHQHGPNVANIGQAGYTGHAEVM